MEKGGLTSLRNRFVVSFAIRPLYSTNVFTVANDAKTKGSALLSTLYLTLFSYAPHVGGTGRGGISIVSITSEKVTRGSDHSVLHQNATRKCSRISFITLAKRIFHSH